MSTSFAVPLNSLKRNPQTNELYLQLPSPHHNIILTPPRWSDIPDILPIHNDPRVYKMLIGPPFPHLPEHAESWLGSVKEKSDALISALEGNPDDKNVATNKDTGLMILGGCPVSSIRELQDDGSDIFLGSLDITRCTRVNYLPDKEREAFVEQNLRFAVGDSRIIWEIGFYLKPSHHGRGIMTLALNTLIKDWAVPNMNVRAIDSSAFEGNYGSVKVFLKNEFSYMKDVGNDEGLVKNCVELPESKGGGVIGIHFLEWRYKAEDDIHSSSR